jgi:hypothetical protein
MVPSVVLAQAVQPLLLLPAALAPRVLARPPWQSTWVRRMAYLSLLEVSLLALLCLFRGIVDWHFCGFVITGMLRMALSAIMFWIFREHDKKGFRAHLIGAGTLLIEVIIMSQNLF